MVIWQLHNQSAISRTHILRAFNMFTAMDKHSIRPAQPGSGRVRKAVLIALAVSLTSLWMPNFAWAGPESDPNLVKLEMKFFEHDYSKDNLTARLSRLEKLVFGETKSGDAAVRLKNLVAAVPNLNQTADQSVAD